MLGKIKAKALQKATKDSTKAATKADKDGFPILARLHRAAAKDTAKQAKKLSR